MDISAVFKFINVVFRVLWERKFLSLFGFALVSFCVLAVGMAWPSKFETSATIFADNQNILKPLLQNQAAQSKVQNTTRVVKEMIHSPRLLKSVAEQVYGVGSFESAEELGQRINGLRSAIGIRGLGSNYIKVTYADETSDQAYRVINAVIDVFIKASSEEQRSESRDAFVFIDNQVKQYKDQLVLAEQKLKEFRSSNFDGRDGDVNASIGRLRDQIEELKIAMDEDLTKINALEKQLAEESEFSASRIKTDAFTQKLQQLEARLNTLLLTYTEDYPDVVSLKDQIADVKKTIKDSNTIESAPQVLENDELIPNPLYQELRSRLSQARTEVKAKERRLSALDELMEGEFERRKRVAERGAEEAELTRDYNVTKRIYEDMLERKEKARLSMTLNVEGQGITYRVQEPPIPPLNPVGLRFLHFVAVGPIVGFGFVVGLAFLYVLVDQKIRFPNQLQSVGVATLAVVPHVYSPFTRAIVRTEFIICVLLGLIIVASYGGLAYASKMGLI